MKSSDLKIGEQYVAWQGTKDEKIGIFVRFTYGWQRNAVPGIRFGEGERLVPVAARSLTPLVPVEKPKQQPNAGTCAICSAPFKLSKDDKLVVHGYKRPGWGFIVGHCVGQKFLPYEFSTEALEAYRPLVVRHLESLRKEGQRLHSGTVEELPHTYSVYVGSTYSNRSCREQRTDWIARGTPATVAEPYRRVPSFDTLLQIAQERNASDTQHAEWELARVDKLITDWVKRPLSIVK